MTDQTEIKRKHPYAQCEVCPLYKSGKFVKPEFNGHKDGTAKFAIVGEAPGATEVRKGKPFVGQSGFLLNETLKEAGLKRHDAVLTNACLCRPPSNATPSANAIAACKPALEYTIEQSAAPVVLALGNSAAASLLGKKDVKVTQDRVGPPKQVKGKSYKVIPSIHPAACLRVPNFFPLFLSDIKKINTPITIKWEPPKFKVFENETQARTAIRQLLDRTRADRLAVDLEVGEDKDVDYGHPNTLLAAGLGYEPGKVAVIGKQAFQSRLVRKELGNLLKEKKLTFQNSKYDLGVFYRMGYGTFTTEFDTMLASYTQNELKGVHALGYQGQEILGTPNWKEIIKRRGGFDKVSLPELYEYNAYDVAVTWDLEDHWREVMDEHGTNLHRFLCEASDRLFIMESDGIYIDQEELGHLSDTMKADLEELTWKLQDFVHDFPPVFWRNHGNSYRLLQKQGYNPNSTAQTKSFLEAMMQATLTTTDKEMLELLEDSKNKEVSKFASMMINHRKVAKLYGTYVKGIISRLDDDGMVRTSFNLIRAETGRLSSSNPNVQNVARESKYGNVRKIYAAREGKRIIYADYANLEGRVVCWLAQSESMRKHMLSGVKIHDVVATEVFGKSFDKEQYVLAKTVVHGVNYARTPEGIADGLNLPLREAKRVHDMYFDLFPEVKPWQESIKHKILHTDEVQTTMFGRKRRFGLITAENQEDVYKEGLAFEPQSIGSDICLKAGIKLHKMGVPTRIFIHDGIVAEVDDNDVPATSALMKQVMEETAAEYIDYIPFPVDVEVGANWGELYDPEK